MLCSRFGSDITGWDQASHAVLLQFAYGARSETAPAANARRVHVQGSESQSSRPPQWSPLCNILMFFRKTPPIECLRLSPTESSVLSPFLFRTLDIGFMNNFNGLKFGVIVSGPILPETIEILSLTKIGENAVRITTIKHPAMRDRMADVKQTLTEPTKFGSAFPIQMFCSFIEVLRHAGYVPW
jgi:hypothetical protein